jgi:hypothetical protein
MLATVAGVPDLRVDLGKARRFRIDGRRTVLERSPYCVGQYPTFKGIEAREEPDIKVVFESAIEHSQGCQSLELLAMTVSRG